YINDDPARLQRATGTAIDPNSFGGLLAVLGALLAPQIVSRRPVVPRWLAVAMVGVMGVAVLATVSRGSMLAFGVGLIVVGLARDRRLLFGALLAGALLLAVARFTPWTSAYVGNLTDGFLAQDRSTQMRLGEYKDALRLIDRYPLLGVGFGGVRDIDLYRGVSSLYLIIAETMGLVGLAAFVLFLAAAALRLLLAWRTMPPDGLRAVVLGCLAALAAASVGGVFDHYFFTYPHAFALLWLILGLGMGAIRLSEQEAAA
ncbi:MAG: O-antigen ligase family protein, partial [Ardenticatenales bacterium]